MNDDKKDKISQSNALTTSRYDFSTTEKNVIYCIIRQVRKDWETFGEIQHDLFENLIIYLDSSVLSNISDKDHTSRARKALRDLRHRDIEIEDEKGNWLNVGIINYASYDAKSKKYEIEVSKKIMPHIVELSKNFTSFSAAVAISLKSKYSQRFYELGCKYRNTDIHTFFLDITTLREMFCLGKGYTLKSDIKRRVIDTALYELKEAYDNKSCDLYLEEWEEGKGNNTRFYFKVNYRQTVDKTNEQEILMLDEDLAYINQFNNAIFKTDPKYCNRIIETLKANNNVIPQVKSRLERLIKEQAEKGKDPGALWRHILMNDFGIK